MSNAPIHWVTTPKTEQSPEPTTREQENKPSPPLKEMAEYMLGKEGYTFKGSNRVEFEGGVLLSFRGTKKVGSENSARYAVAMIESDGTMAWFETMSRKEKEKHTKFVGNRNRGNRRSQLANKE